MQELRLLFLFRMRRTASRRQILTGSAETAWRSGAGRRWRQRTPPTAPSTSPAPAADPAPPRPRTTDPTLTTTLWVQIYFYSVFFLRDGKCLYGVEAPWFWLGVNLCNLWLIEPRGSETWRQICPELRLEFSNFNIDVRLYSHNIQRILLKVPNTNNAFTHKNLLGHYKKCGIKCGVSTWIWETSQQKLH